jgi:hypothetical protein
MYVAAIFAIFCVAVIVTLCGIVRRAAFSTADLPATAEWIDELSVERYRPMLRLLDSRDLEFLRAQPGFNPRMEVQLRRQRCQIFEGYLRALSADFRKVCAAVKVVMLCSKHDRPDLASAVLHHQLVFGLGFLQVQLALRLYRWGLCNVDVSSLIKVFDVTRIELRSLVPSNEFAS